MNQQKAGKKNYFVVKIQMKKKKLSNKLTKEQHQLKNEGLKIHKIGTRTWIFQKIQQ